MSRFDEQFERDLGAIAERVTPSPDAWAEIQQRIADREPNRETEIIMLVENTPTTRRWPLIAAAAAVAALTIGAVALVSRDDATELPADEPEPVPTVASAPEADNGSGSAAADLPDSGAWVAPGRYTTDQLGMDVSFDLPRELYLETSRPGQVMLLGALEGDLELSTMTPDNLIVLRFERLAGWSTPDEALTSRNTGSIDPYDIDEWIATNDVVVSADRETEVDGRATRALHARVSPDSESAVECFVDWKPCSYPRAIADDGTGQLGNWLSSRRDERWHVVTIDGSEPLVIIAGGPDGGVWFDQFDDIVLPSIEIGPDAPPLDYSAPALIVGDRAAADGDASVEEATALLDTSVDAGNEADRTSAIEAFGTDAVLRVPGGTEYAGEDAANWMAQWVDRFPRLRRVSSGMPAENGGHAFDVVRDGNRITDERVLVITMAGGELLVTDERMPDATG